MNGVRIYVSNDITNKNIILNGDVLDLFNDENILINLKQTDIKDISKNYTDFTQDFTVPASPKNNKIFKYWYDINNDNQWGSVSGIPCRIDIDGFFFKKGTIKINSAQIDDNGNIKFFSIQFTGNLKSLKDTFGDSKIDSLNFENILSPSQLQFYYTDTFVYNKLTSIGGEYLEFPLISTKKFIYDFQDIKYNPLIVKGLSKAELRPALKISNIFKAIESNYNLKFSGGFYNSNILDNLYIWLNRNEDVVTNATQFIDIEGSITGTSPHITYNTIENYVIITKPTSIAKVVSAKITVNTSTPTINYKLYIQRLVLNSDETINENLTLNQDNGGYIASHNEYVTGNKSLTIGVATKDIPVGGKIAFRFAIESVGSINITSYKLQCGYVELNGLIQNTVINTLNSSNALTFIPSFNVVKSLPEITIYDFFISFVKMFNLVIIPITDPIKLSELKKDEAYKLEYFKDYYGKLNEVNITNYTKKAIKINKIKTYKSIEFKYIESNNYNNITYKKNQIDGREYGCLLNKSLNVSDDGEYKVETKFGLMIWREVPNTYAADSLHNLNETWIIADGVDDTLAKGVFNKPIIFFSNGISNIPVEAVGAPVENTKKIGYIKEDLTVIPISQYNIFSNVDVLDELTYTTSLTFSKEPEFQGINTFSTSKNLYSNNYEDLVTAIYSPYSREYEVSAILPKHIYTNLNLGSRIIVKNHKYNITDLSINLTNGETKLKLNNVIDTSPIVDNYVDNNVNIETISTKYILRGGYTERKIKINYPASTYRLRWKADYKITNNLPSYKVSFTTDSNTSGGLIWYDYYNSDTIGNHTTTFHQFLPVGTYINDTATSYSSPISGTLIAKTGNTITITVIAYDINGGQIAQDAVSI